jgi:Papain family cysteine protease
MRLPIHTDIACWMRVVFQQYLYVGTGRLEPKYDENTYPNSMDWRDYGAVSDVRKQGDCGACWAITAVETVESAYFIGTGSLVDLSESEVISCTDTCNMCYGGWPQDAYDYVMDHKGIMLRSDWAYDGSTLLALSQEMEGGDSELDSDLFGSYISATCPASQKSGDNQNGGSRYGSIKGYGFATERCVCYSDGSGCNCDNQNEGTAVRNLASYGPATVCLDASTWQDYNGGIITSSSGCSAKFLSMNHCVQVVGKFSGKVMMSALATLTQPSSS